MKEAGCVRQRERKRKTLKDIEKKKEVEVNVLKPFTRKCLSRCQEGLFLTKRLT